MNSEEKLASRIGLAAGSFDANGLAAELCDFGRAVRRRQSSFRPLSGLRDMQLVRDGQSNRSGPDEDGEEDMQVDDVPSSASRSMVPKLKPGAKPPPQVAQYEFDDITTITDLLAQLQDKDQPKKDQDNKKHSLVPLKVPASVEPSMWNAYMAITTAIIANEQTKMIQERNEKTHQMLELQSPYLLYPAHTARLLSESFGCFIPCIFADRCIGMVVCGFPFVQHFTPAHYQEYLRTKGQKPAGLSPMCLVCETTLETALVHVNRSNSHNTFVVPRRTFCLPDMPGHYKRSSLNHYGATTTYTDGDTMPSRRFQTNDFIKDQLREEIVFIDDQQKTKEIRCCTEKSSLLFVNKDQESSELQPMYPPVVLDLYVPDMRCDVMLRDQLVRPGSVELTPVTASMIDEQVRIQFETIMDCTAHLGVRPNLVETRLMTMPNIPIFLRKCWLFFRPLDEARMQLLGLLASSSVTLGDLMTEYGMNLEKFEHSTVLQNDVISEKWAYIRSSVSFHEHMCFYLMLGMFELVETIRRAPETCVVPEHHLPSGAEFDQKLTAWKDAHANLFRWYLMRLKKDMPITDRYLLLSNPSEEGFPISVNGQKGAQVTNTWFEIMEPFPQRYISIKECFDHTLGGAQTRGSVSVGVTERYASDYETIRSIATHLAIQDEKLIRLVFAPLLDTIQTLCKPEFRRFQVPFMDTWTPCVPEFNETINKAKPINLHKTFAPFAKQFNETVVHVLEPPKDEKEISKWWNNTPSKSHGYVILASICTRVCVAQQMLKTTMEHIFEETKQVQHVAFQDKKSVSLDGLGYRGAYHQHMLDRLSPIKMENDTVLAAKKKLKQHVELAQALKRFLGSHIPLIIEMMKLKDPNDAQLNGYGREESNHLTTLESFYPTETQAFAYENMTDYTWLLSQTELLGSICLRSSVIANLVTNCMLPFANITAFSREHPVALETVEYQTFMLESLVATMAGLYPTCRTACPFQKRVLLELSVYEFRQETVETFRTGFFNTVAYVFRERILNMVANDPAFSLAIQYEFEHFPMVQKLISRVTNLFRGSFNNAGSCTSNEQLAVSQTNSSEISQHWYRNSAPYSLDLLIGLKGALKEITKTRLSEEIMETLNIPSEQPLRPPRAVVMELVEYIQAIEPGMPVQYKWFETLNLEEETLKFFESICSETPKTIRTVFSKDYLRRELTCRLSSRDCSILLFFVTHLLIHYSRRLVALPKHVAKMQQQSVRLYHNIQPNQTVPPWLFEIQACPLTGCNVLHVAFSPPTKKTTNTKNKEKKKKNRQKNPTRVDLTFGTLVCSVKRHKTVSSDFGTRLEKILTDLKKCKLTEQELNTLDKNHHRVIDYMDTKEDAMKHAKKYAQHIVGLPHSKKCSEFPLQGLDMCGYICEFRKLTSNDLSDTCKTLMLCPCCGRFATWSRDLYDYDGLQCQTCLVEQKTEIEVHKRCIICGYFGDDFREFSKHMKANANDSGYSRSVCLPLVSEKPWSPEVATPSNVCSDCSPVYYQRLGNMFTREDIQDFIDHPYRYKTNEKFPDPLLCFSEGQDVQTLLDNARSKLGKKPK